MQAAVGKALGAGAQEAAAKAATAAAETAAKTAATEVATKAATTAAAEAGGAAAAAAAGAATKTAAGRSAGLLARALPWAGRALGGLGLFLHSEDLNSGEREYLRQRGAYGQPAPSGAPASPPVPAGQPSAANAPAGGTLAERLANSALGRLIARGEGGYSSVNRGARGGYAAGTEDLANMTLAEVMAAQRSGKFNAAGRYQIVRDTLAEAARALNLKGDEKFDQKLQDRIFGDYLLTRKRRAIGDFLSGKSSDLHAALLATSREWASVANPDTGRSYYDGVGKNHASITAKELENALRNSQSLFGPAGALTLAQRAAPQVEIHNDVKIQVAGAADPSETARAVGREQQTVADATLRNMQGAFQ
ncbi:hypothetical protein PPH41_22635 [Burkholderia gladioli]|nr:hypothetical protein [Burkholderia gladioli]